MYNILTRFMQNFYSKGRVCSRTSWSQTLKRSYYYKDFVVRKPIFGVSDTVIFKPACSASETSCNIQFSLVTGLDMILFNKRIIKALKYGWLTYNIGLDARKCVFGFVNNKSADQSDHQLRLTNAFIVRSSDRNLSKLVRGDIQKFLASLCRLV